MIYGRLPDTQVHLRHGQIVWHKLGVPRYSFLHWLIMHGRVATLSRLKRFGVVLQDNCYFCISGIENIYHLFLECPYTHHVLSQVLHGRTRTLNVPAIWTSWKQEMENFDKGSLLCSIKTLVFQTVCYAIWRERNNRFHNGEINHPN